MARETVAVETPATRATSRSPTVRVVLLVEDGTPPPDRQNVSRRIFYPL
jgi:hypothetical protein